VVEVEDIIALLQLDQEKMVGLLVEEQDNLLEEQVIHLPLIQYKEWLVAPVQQHLNIVLVAAVERQLQEHLQLIQVLEAQVEMEQHQK